MPARHLPLGRLAALACLFCLAATGCAASPPAVDTAQGQPAPGGPAGTKAGTPAPAAAAAAWTVIPAQLGDTWVYAIDSSVLNLTVQFTDAADGSVTFASASVMGAKLAFPNLSWPSPATLTPGHPRTTTITQTILGSKTTERLTITDIGPAPVTVPAGSYQATLLEQTVTASGGSQDTVKTWIVNGIGQVKTETTVTVEGKPFASTAQTLTSFTKG
jgi:hypothetical protein